MRTLAITQNITLDGSIELLGDWIQPQEQGDSADLLDELHRQDRESDGLVLGRRTFEDFRRYWPNQPVDPTGITAYLNEVQKYVVSWSMTDPGWQKSTVLSLGEVGALKEQRAWRATPGHAGRRAWPAPSRRGPCGKLHRVLGVRWLDGTTSRLAYCSAAITTSARP
jgi:hypothetical protein